MQKSRQRVSSRCGRRFLHFEQAHLPFWGGGTRRNAFVSISESIAKKDLALAASASNTARPSLMRQRPRGARRLSGRRAYRPHCSPRAPGVELAAIDAHRAAEAAADLERRLDDGCCARGAAGPVRNT